MISLMDVILYVSKSGLVAGVFIVAGVVGRAMWDSRREH